MPAPRSKKQHLKRWTERIASADKAYKLWSDKYDCPGLAEYYEGHHWRDFSDEEARKKYTINLIFPTVETQLPSLMFDRPLVKVDPKPGHAQNQGSNAPERADLLKQTLQTYIDNEDLGFTLETDLAMRDAFSHFGMVEVGYTADYLDNPNAGKPMLEEDSDDSAVDEDGNPRPLLDDDGNPVLQPEKVLDSESLFVKRIAPEQVRVSVSGRNRLETNDWVGYYEWVYVEDVKRNPIYQNTARLKPSGVLSDVADTTIEKDGDVEKYTGMVRIWKIWDLREKVKRVLADGHDQWLLEAEPYKVLPLAPLKFLERRNEWYPLPPIFNWISPQDEINETREMQRIHRKRFTRRYTVKPGAIDSTELEKLESGEDGVYAMLKSTQENPIEAVPDAPLDGANWTHLAAGREDFTLITGTSGDQRGVPDATTATQANIVNTRAQLRESKARRQVGAWLAHICRLLALTIIERMQEPMWIRAVVDPFAMDGQAIAQADQSWQQIEAEQLAGFDFDVKVDLASLSPVAEEADAERWLRLLQLFVNQGIFVLLFTPDPATPMGPSPVLRRTLGYFGLKNEAEVQSIWRLGTMILGNQLLQLVMQQAGSAGVPAGPGPSSAPAAATSGLPAAGPKMAS